LSLNFSKSHVPDEHRIGGGYGNDETGDSVQAPKLEEVDFQEFEHGTEQETTGMVSRAVFVHVLGNQSGKTVDRL